MTDEEVEDLFANNFGSYPESPFHDSVTKRRKVVPDIIRDEEDGSIDFNPETDEIIIIQSLSIDAIIDHLDESINEDFSNTEK